MVVSEAILDDSRWILILKVGLLCSNLSLPQQLEFWGLETKRVCVEASLSPPTSTG